MLHAAFPVLRAVLAVAVAMAAGAPFVAAGPREREPLAVFQQRRAALRAKVDGPVVLFGYTGREQASPSYIFQQEENFYYLTGHAQEGAALLLLPDKAPEGKAYEGPREVLYLPARNLQRERWDSLRLGPHDPAINEKTGFAAVRPFAELRADLGNIVATWTSFYTLLPRPNSAGYPHEANWLDWLKKAMATAEYKSVAAAIAEMRQIKSPGEIALLQKAIDLSLDAHFEAMRRMRPGIYEFEIAAAMEWVHKRGGSEVEGYAPIVGSGFFSTVLHYNDLGKKIEDGDMVVLDVGASYSAYVADITRTLPANGKFTPRQREIYEIVLGAQNAVFAAIKPGMSLGGDGPNSLGKIARDYINAHGKDLKGEPLGKYFIHGLGHQIGLNVHDVAPIRELKPGMVITIEPGIYIPEENLGVRIEDDLLITETGYKLLSARLPRTVAEIEKFMAEAKKRRTSTDD
jgi:Xaa-Pro aminopeptidase